MPTVGMWFAENFIVMNPGKTVYMRVHFACPGINYVSEVKNLNLIFDEHLSWKK